MVLLTQAISRHISMTYLYINNSWKDSFLRFCEPPQITLIFHGSRKRYLNLEKKEIIHLLKGFRNHVVSFYQNIRNVLQNEISTHFFLKKWINISYSSINSSKKMDLMLIVCCFANQTFANQIYLCGTPKTYW